MTRRMTEGPGDISFDVSGLLLRLPLKLVIPASPGAVDSSEWLLGSGGLSEAQRFGDGGVAATVR